MTEQYPHYRRNFACLVGDWVGFVTGMALASYTSVIPSFVNQLTDSPPLIGLAAAIPNGAWLLPQLLAANYVGNRQKKKPWVITMGLIGRPTYFLLTLFVFVAGDKYPWLLLGVFFAAELVFSVADGLATVAWFDILSNVIPPQRRGRFYSTAQVTTALLSLVAGAAVGRVLGPGGPSFPYNYGLLFLACGALMMLSLGSFAPIKEPVREVQRDREPWRAYLPRLAYLFRQDRQFRVITVVRLLAALGGLALPFYVVHATDVLDIRAESIGLFVSAQVIGGLIASLAMGYLNERSGSRIVTQLTVLLGLAIPLAALAFHFRLVQGPIAPYVYGLVFLLVGASYSGYTQGFMNLVLEIAPPEDRTAYVGLYNTLGGMVIIVMPLLGGWLLQATSYPVLFSVAAVGLVTALGLSLVLKEPRAR